MNVINKPHAVHPHECHQQASRCASSQDRDRRLEARPSTSFHVCCIHHVVLGCSLSPGGTQVSTSRLETQPINLFHVCLVTQAMPAVRRAVVSLENKLATVDVSAPTQLDALALLPLLVAEIQSLGFEAAPHIEYSPGSGQ